jgi:hypothetical protein
MTLYAFHLSEATRLPVILRTSPPVAHARGIVEVFVGSAEGASLRLRTDVVARTATAQEYTAATRLYGSVEGDLLWAMDMAATGNPLGSHASARLKKVPVPSGHHP